MPVRAKFVRIAAVRWIKHISMRAALLIGEMCTGYKFAFKWSSIRPHFFPSMHKLIRHGTKKITSLAQCKAVCESNPACKAITVIDPCQKDIQRARKPSAGQDAVLKLGHQSSCVRD